MKNESAAINKLYNKYEYLAMGYARKVILTPASCWEYEDVVQELRIRLFTAIKTYSVSFASWKKTGRCKPIPLQYYLKTTMNNKIIDIIKLMRTNHDNQQKLSVQSDNFDIGESMDRSDLNLEKQSFVVNGVDLTQGLVGDLKSAFNKFLLGFPTKELAVEFEHIPNLNAIIKQQVNRLREMRNELVPTHKQTYHSYQLQED